MPRLMHASIVLPASEDISMELGLRLAGFFSAIHIASEQQENSIQQAQDSLDSFFHLRQGRIRIGANFHNTRIFLQTDIKSDTNISAYIGLIDALFIFKMHPLLSVYGGIHLPPSHRDSITSSLTSLSIERPIISTKPLTWFNQGPAVYFNDQHNLQDNYFQNTFSILIPKSAYEERDIGLTLFGTHSFHSRLHFKYYSGIYNGSKVQQEDIPQVLRLTQRIQLNFLDPESNYFSYGTYLGELKTIAIGASVDYQNGISIISPIPANTEYFFYSLDLFVELPLASHLSFTIDSAFSSLSLGGKAPTKEGVGWYTQCALTFHKIQPWITYERWVSQLSDFGSFHASRGGFTYFISGHNLKLSTGWEWIRTQEFKSFTTHNTFITEIKFNI